MQVTGFLLTSPGASSCVRERAQTRESIDFELLDDGDIYLRMTATRLTTNTEDVAHLFVRRDFNVDYINLDKTLFEIVDNTEYPLTVVEESRLSWRLSELSRKMLPRRKPRSFFEREQADFNPHDVAARELLIKDHVETLLRQVRLTTPTASTDELWPLLEQARLEAPLSERVGHRLRAAVSR